MRSTVYLIGAGPGAPDLITLRGYRCLQQADVVIFDHLVHPDLLAVAPNAAERIDVGSAAPEQRDQEAICYLLAEKAREGKTVARLKWGDPFFFDRGGEEALFLHEQGVELRSRARRAGGGGRHRICGHSHHLSRRRRHRDLRARP